MPHLMQGSKPSPEQHQHQQRKDSQSVLLAYAFSKAGTRVRHNQNLILGS